MSTTTIISLWLISTAAIVLTVCKGSSINNCIKSEREALLGIKQHIFDGSNLLSSWGGDGDCCNWVGVVCNNVTGHVTELHLRNPHCGEYFSRWGFDALREGFWESKLRGNLSNSLLDMKHLIYLDLSCNDFGGSQIPTFLGSMQSLRYLDLSMSNFGGTVPSQLGNLTNLNYLSIGGEPPYQLETRLVINNLQWLSGLSQLKRLDLSYVDLNNAFDWLKVMNTLPFLLELRLSSCSLPYIPELSVVNFTSLAVLDLSWNFFYNSSIPAWIFTLNNLVFIDLSSNNFQGPLPVCWKNLSSSIKHIDLSDNHFDSSIPIWLYSFSSLFFLDLSSNNMGGSISNTIRNLTSLTTLQLSGNDFMVDGETLKSIGHLCKLRSIDLSYIELNRDISDIFRILSTCVSDELESLFLLQCRVFGALNDHDLRQFRNLKDLFLGGNKISGTIPLSLGELSYLRMVDLTDNLMEGVISELHFANLKRLILFTADRNSLKLKISPTWIPPFQITILSLESLHVGPAFPFWLRSQKRLALLNMHNSSISDTIPNWFWDMSSNIFYLNLSVNQLHGEITHLDVGRSRGFRYFAFKNITNINTGRSMRYAWSVFGFAVVDLSSNYFKGGLPSVPLGVVVFDVSNNSFSGSLSNFLCPQINESKRMQFLNLAQNLLVGEIPNCWMKWQRLVAVKLNYNNFTGSLPSSIGDLKLLQSLHLRNNRFSGQFPQSLENSTRLMTIDFSENEFGGRIPAWISRLSSLKILSLRSNKFHGSIPDELCGLIDLQILDLAHNSLSGSIPHCINNFNAMATSNYSENYMLYDTTWGTFIEEAMLLVKGNVVEYTTILKLVKVMDISNNSLSGEIPVEFTQLVNLYSLNLSLNFLTGKIPENIGAMRSLESVDLSKNQLSGKIPQSISSLDFLSKLDLSYNKLTGRIPSSTQIDGFDASSFAGNQLCGYPLSDCESCDANKDTGCEAGEEADYRGGFEVQLLYWDAVALGFVVGFWIVVGPLAFIQRWRHAYFQCLNSLLRHKIDVFKSIISFIIRTR